MSAALQLPVVWGASDPQEKWEIAAVEDETRLQEPAEEPKSGARATGPIISLGFYRRHTESLLRRYLYASMQVGRTPSILGDSVGRGWASSRVVKTFEDAVIFVLDVERCLDKLGSLDRALLSKIVLQAYTQYEAAALLGMTHRVVAYKFQQALDRLTEKLLDSGLLVIPKS